MKKGLEKLLSLPKSFKVSRKLVSFRAAFRLPCLVHKDCVVKSLKGKLVSDVPLCKGAFSFGFGNVGIFDPACDRGILEIDGEIRLSGTANFGTGSRLSVGPEAVLSLGENFTNTAALTLVCRKRIDIGADALVSWNSLIMDSDFHRVENIRTGEISPKETPVSIGSGVWIGTGATILKGSVIPDGCIVGASSLVNKSFQEKNSLIAGNPASVRRGEVRLHRR